MSNRKSSEEKVLEFFTSAPLGKVEVVFNLCRGVLKGRQGALESPAQQAVRGRKKKKATAASSSAPKGKSTDFPGAGADRALATASE